jgi:hypothetical protein
MIEIKTTLTLDVSPALLAVVRGLPGGRVTAPAATPEPLKAERPATPPPPPPAVKKATLAASTFGELDEAGRLDVLKEKANRLVAAGKGTGARVVMQALGLSRVSETPYGKQAPLNAALDRLLAGEKAGDIVGDYKQD